jgi:DNA-binding transcriptional ArsR family regulator
MRPPHHPERNQLELSAVLYALSDPTRMEVVRRLAGEVELACGTFGLPTTKATLSHHFKVLREAGLIHTRVEGVHRYNSLRKQDLEARFPGLLKAVLKASGQS